MLHTSTEGLNFKQTVYIGKFHVHMNILKIPHVWNFQTYRIEYCIICYIISVKIDDMVLPQSKLISSQLFGVIIFVRIYLILGIYIKKYIHT